MTVPPDDHLGPEILRRTRQREKAAWEAIVLAERMPGTWRNPRARSVRKNGMPVIIEQEIWALL